MLALGWDVHGMESGWCAVCSGASPRQSASTPASNLQLSVQSIQARLHSQLLSGARCGKVMCSSHSAEPHQREQRHLQDQHPAAVALVGSRAPAGKASEEHGCLVRGNSHFSNACALVRARARSGRVGAAHLRAAAAMQTRYIVLTMVRYTASQCRCCQGLVPAAAKRGTDTSSTR